MSPDVRGLADRASRQCSRAGHPAQPLGGVNRDLVDHATGASAAGVERIRSRGVVLDVAAVDPKSIVDVMPHGGERIVEHGAHVVVAVLHDGDLVAGDRQVDLHLERRTVPLMSVRLVDPHMAVLDPVAEVIEARDPRSCGGCHGRAGRHPAECDLQRCLHTNRPCIAQASSHRAGISISGARSGTAATAHLASITSRPGTGR